MTVEKLNEYKVPFFVVHNKSDLNPLNGDFKNMVEKGLNTKVLEFSTLWQDKADDLPEVACLMLHRWVESAP